MLKLLFLFSVILLVGCDIDDRKAMEKLKEDRANYLKSLGLEPYNQYGTVYRVGSFGGVPVMLDESFGRETKESAEGIKYIKQSPETFDKLISSLDTEFRYTDGAIYVRYHTAPRNIVEQRDSEQQYDSNHTWVSVSYSNNYQDPQPLDRYETVNYHADYILNAKKHHRLNDVYIYHSNEYGLERYVLDEKSKQYYANLPHRTSPTDTLDVYFSRDKAGNYIDMIKCSNHHRPMSKRCTLVFTLKAQRYIVIHARFQRVHLKDWQKIKQMSIDRIESVMVKDKDVLRRIEDYHHVKP